MSSQDEFLSQIRDALNHLYDYHYLESHPLALRYWPEVIRGRSGRAEWFNRLLLESIEELSPPDVPSRDTSRARFYSLLVYRYVEEWPLPEIMRELGYSRSQFFREQRKAVAMLASVLREKLPSAARLASSSNHRAGPREELSRQTPSLTQQDDVLHAEASRVLARREAVGPAEVVQGVLETISSLAEQHGVTWVCALDPGLPSIYGSRILLLQVFLKGLSSLISQPSAQQVCVRMRYARQRLTTELITRLSPSNYRSDNAAGRPVPNLEPVRRLVEMVGGHWQGIEVSPGDYTCYFDLPAGSRKTLLVIEDNEGIIRVFRGYLAGHDYQVVGVTTGDEALRLAREVNPTAITLDIMMPTQDGWEILQALKNDLATRHIPVIICSVLADPGLALSLGAIAYLSKPVTQADLLAALDSLPGAA